MFWIFQFAYSRRSFRAWPLAGSLCYDTPAKQLEHDNSITFSMTVAYLPLGLLRHTMRISAYKMQIYEYFENAYL